jgi:hypothetical protein
MSCHPNDDDDDDKLCILQLWIYNILGANNGYILKQH